MLLRLPAAATALTTTRARRPLLAALALALTLLAGCGTPRPAATPPAPMPAPAAPPPAAAGAFPQAQGEVIGRSERLLIYLPRAGDRLPAIAARLLGDAGLHWRISEANAGLREPVAHQPLVVPLVALNPLGVRDGEFQTIPILCYHRFGTGNSKMIISPASFAAQLDWLARNGFHVIRLAELGDFLAGRAALPQRAVVITIDDGYESVHQHAFPLLKKHGFPATLFVYNDFIGTGAGLSWAQLQEMAASGLVDIQAHSRTHRNLIERLPGESEDRYRQAIDNELRAPRELLERRLAPAKVRVRHFAYPFGDANDVVLEAMARLNYDLGVTVNPGGNAFFAQPTMLRRTMIFGDLDLEGFKSKLQTRRSFGAP